MSKKIRVAWEDLQPGDLIHVKGSTNVYQFIRFNGNKNAVLVCFHERQRRRITRLS